LNTKKIKTNANQNKINRDMFSFETENLDFNPSRDMVMIHSRANY